MYPEHEHGNEQSMIQRHSRKSPEQRSDIPEGDASTFGTIVVDFDGYVDGMVKTRYSYAMLRYATVELFVQINDKSPTRLDWNFTNYGTMNFFFLYGTRTFVLVSYGTTRFSLVRVATTMLVVVVVIPLRYKYKYEVLVVTRAAHYFFFRSWQYEYRTVP